MTQTTEGVEQATEGVEQTTEQTTEGFEQTRPESENVPAFWNLLRWSRRSQVKLLLIILLVVAIVVFVSIGNQEFTQWIKDFGQWSESNRVPAAFALAGVYSICAVFLIPAALLTIVAGFILGLPVGCLSVIAGSNLGACLAFLNARFLIKEWVDLYLVSKYPQLQALAHVISDNGFNVVVLLRLSPLLPFNALNYCLAVTPVAFAPYLAATSIGMLPGTVLYVYIGSSAASLTDVVAGNTRQTPLQQVLFWVGLGLTIAVTVGLTLLARRRLREHMNSSQGDMNAPISPYVGDAPDGIEPDPQLNR